MPSTLLTDLSTDVLRIIFTFLAENGDDIEHISRTNRLLRNVSVPFIQEHRYSCASDRNPCTIPRVLRDLILDPPVARHVKSMEITDHLCVANWSIKYLINESKFKELVMANVDVYRRAVERLIPQEIQGLWIKGIENANDDVLKALVILLSPHMKSLDLEMHNEYGWAGQFEAEKAHFFLDYLRHTQWTPHLRPEINLESASIHMHHAYSPKEVLDIAELLPLMTLPKLMALTISDVQGPFTSTTRLTNNNSEILRTSPLKILEIKHSCLGAEGLNMILSGIIALEKFECRISDNDGGYSSGHTDSLGQLLKAIETNTSHSLKSLNLVGNDTHGVKGGGYTLEEIPTFRNFTALTHLKLNPEIFHTSFIFSPLPELTHINTSITPSSFATPYNHPHPAAAYPSTNSILQPEIASLMPPNLEILELEGLIRNGESAARVVDKLYELLGGMDMYLPRLRKIVVRDVGGEHGCWIEEERVGLRMACEMRGVEVDFRSSFEIRRM